jgi:hypothetical protein
LETIGLIAAMTQESDALLRRVGDSERVALEPYRARRFELAGRN